ncbi:hypothetical protein BLNAU_8625 [Blattamonas nauphoetae]|uniref:Inositol polyphosphate-related phosphatase domain-containing protein n=1 Tax=Blattamonas nauphoetae TaxID=2049346 RepID=A0ABQ9XY41_9EUKA|nr:hypothetical protein BLNAU_8625 [Blattamonas nauphoetae]
MLKAVQFVPLVSAGLSIISCCFVIINYLLSARRYPIFSVKIQFWLALVEVINAASIFTELIPKCLAASLFVKQFSTVAAHGWSLIYTIVQYSIVVFRYRRTHKFEPLYHAIVWSYSLLSVIASVVEFLIRGKSQIDIPIDVRIDKLISRVALCYSFIILIDIACTILVIQVLVVNQRDKKMHSDVILNRRFRTVTMKLIVLLTGYVLIHVLWVVDCMLGFFSVTWASQNTNAFHITERALTPLAGVVNMIVYFIEIKDRISRKRRQKSDAKVQRKALMSFDRFRNQELRQHAPDSGTYPLTSDNSEEKISNLDISTALYRLFTSTSQQAQIKPSEQPSSVRSFSSPVRELPPSLSVFMMTFNLGCYYPSDLDVIFATSNNERGEPAIQNDLLFLGFQEALLNKESEISEGYTNLQDLPNTLSEFLNSILHDTHALVISETIQGIQSFLFAKHDLIPFIQVKRTSKEAFGKMQLLGNKGSVALLVGIGEESSATKIRRKTVDWKEVLSGPNKRTIKLKKSSGYASLDSTIDPFPESSVLHAGSTILLFSNSHLNAFAWRGWERMQNVKSLVAGMSATLSGDGWNDDVQQELKENQRKAKTTELDKHQTQMTMTMTLRKTKTGGETKQHTGRLDYSVLLPQYSDKLDHSFLTLNPIQQSELAKVFVSTLTSLTPTQSSLNKLDLTHPFDCVVFLGDLNYRLDLPFDETLRRLEPFGCVSVKMGEEKNWRKKNQTPKDPELNVNALSPLLTRNLNGEQSSYIFDSSSSSLLNIQSENQSFLETSHALLFFDQLQIQRSKHKLFFGFTEPSILPILPSYRLVHHRPPHTRTTREYVFSNKKNQTPSFTDRILTKHAFGRGSQIRKSMRIGRRGLLNHGFDCLTSDHAPVSEKMTIVVNPPSVTIGDLLGERMNVRNSPTTSQNPSLPADQAILSFDVDITRIECVNLQPITINDIIDPFVSVSSTSLDLPALADAVQFCTPPTPSITSFSTTVFHNSTSPVWEKAKGDFRMETEKQRRVKATLRKNEGLFVDRDGVAEKDFFRFTIYESQVQFLFESLLLSRLNTNNGLTSLAHFPLPQTPTHTLVTLPRLELLRLLSLALSEAVGAERIDLVVMDAGLVGDDCVVGACSVRMSLEGHLGVKVTKQDVPQTQSISEPQQKWDLVNFSGLGEILDGDATLLIPLPRYSPFTTHVKERVEDKKREKRKQEEEQRINDELRARLDPDVVPPPVEAIDETKLSFRLINQEELMKEEEEKENGRAGLFWRTLAGRNETTSSLHQFVSQLIPNTGTKAIHPSTPSLLHALVSSFYTQKSVHLVVPLMKDTILTGACSLAMTIRVKQSLMLRRELEQLKVEEMEAKQNEERRKKEELEKAKKTAENIEKKKKEQKEREDFTLEFIQGDTF